MRSLEMPLLRWPVSLQPLRTSFFELVYFYILDWFMVVALGGVYYAVHILHPFHRFVGKYMLDDLRYPMKPDTVPFMYIPVISVGAPLVVVMVYYLYKRDTRDLHHALLGLAFSIAFAGVVTNAVKVTVGRPRPDFFWRCFPDGQDSYAPSGEVICTGDESVIRQGRKSFPSGHASWCFTGLGYLSLYLAGKLQLFDRQGHVWKLVLPFVPLAAATYIGFTRLEDDKHHWEDVFVGALIGLVSAILSYRQHFPSLGDVNCRETCTQMTFQRRPSDVSSSARLSVV